MEGREKRDGRCLLVLATWLAALASGGCRERAAASDAGPALDPIDAVYERYEKDHTWVDPADPSKALVAEPQNDGSFATCAHCDYDICYEPLPIEGKLRLTSDTDLAKMVRWLRSPDTCMRRVAEDLSWPKLGLGSGGMSVSVQDTQGVEYHSILCAIKARLDATKTPYDPKIFDGTTVSLTAKEVASLLTGTWREAVGSSSNRQLVLEFTTDGLRLDDQTVHPEPNAVPRSWSGTNAEGELDAMSRYALDAHSKEGAVRHFLFWPITHDLVYMAVSNQGAALGSPDWKKMKKAR